MNVTLTRDLETGRYHYQPTPWTPRYDQTIRRCPDQCRGHTLNWAGNCTRARRTMVRDRIARRPRLHTRPCELPALPGPNRCTVG